MEQKDTKTRILYEATRLFYEYGYEKTTMRMIARKVGISHVNILNHYQSKVDVAGHIVRNYLAGLAHECLTILANVPKKDDSMFRHTIWWSLHYRLMSENDIFRKFYISYYKESPARINTFTHKAFNAPTADSILDLGRFTDTESDGVLRSIFEAIDANLIGLIELGELDYISACGLMMHLVVVSDSPEMYDAHRKQIKETVDSYLPTRKIDVLNEYLLD